MGPPSRESSDAKTAAMMPEIIMMIAAGFAIADPAPSQAEPNSTATRAVACSCELAEKIVSSGKKRPTINALRKENHSQTTVLLLGLCPRDVGIPSAEVPIATTTIGKKQSSPLQWELRCQSQVVV